MDASVQIAVATGIGAGVGAFVANLFFLFNGWRERVAANKRHRREWAIKTAIEEWNRNTELAKHINSQGRSVYLLPIDTHIISTLALFDAIGDERVDETNVHAILDRMHIVIAAAIENTEKYTKERKGP